MKQSFYKRAKVSGFPTKIPYPRGLQAKRSAFKALYDADYEKDKIPLIQSVILLSFWLAEEDDREGSWQWHGRSPESILTINRCPTNSTAYGDSYGGCAMFGTHGSRLVWAAQCAFISTTATCRCPPPLTCEPYTIMCHLRKLRATCQMIQATPFQKCGRVSLS
jgi:hypothetical protein